MNIGIIVSNNNNNVTVRYDSRTRIWQRINSQLVNLCFDAKDPRETNLWSAIGTNTTFARVYMYYLSVCQKKNLRGSQCATPQYKSNWNHLHMKNYYSAMHPSSSIPASFLRNQEEIEAWRRPRLAMHSTSNLQQPDTGVGNKTYANNDEHRIDATSINCTNVELQVWNCYLETDERGRNKSQIK